MNPIDGMPPEDETRLEELLRDRRRWAAPRSGAAGRLLAAMPPVPAAGAATPPRAAWRLAALAAAMLFTLGVGGWLLWRWQFPAHARLEPPPVIYMRCSFQIPGDKSVAVLEVGDDGVMSLFAEGDCIARHRIVGISRTDIRIQDTAGDATVLVIPLSEYPATAVGVVQARVAEFENKRAADTLDMTDLCLAMLWARQLHPEALALVREVSDAAPSLLQRAARLALSGGEMNVLNRLVLAALKPDHPYRWDAFCTLLKSDNLLAIDTMRQIAARVDDAYRDRAREYLAGIGQ